MASGLDQSIIDLCERYGLASASVSHMRAEHRSWFHGSVQWTDESKPHGRGIATHNANSFVEALEGAVVRMHALRADIIIPTDALELAA